MMRDNVSGYQWDKSFDVAAEVGEMSRLSKLRQRHHYRMSAIDKYRGELAALYAAGLSFAKLALWLMHRKKIAVSRSALHRRMKHWPEVTIRGRRRG